MVAEQNSTLKMLREEGQKMEDHYQQIMKVGKVLLNRFEHLQNSNLFTALLVCIYL